MEITPLLTSVENRGPRDMILEKIFLGLADGLRPEIKRPLLIYARKVGCPGHVFGEIFLGEGSSGILA
jgi:hypothetical protein